MKLNSDIPAQPPRDAATVVLLRGQAVVKVGATRWRVRLWPAGGGKQDAGFFKRFPQRGYKQAAGGGLVGLAFTQGRMEVLRCAVEVGMVRGLAVGSVKFAAGKHIGTTQHV